MQKKQHLEKAGGKVVARLEKSPLLCQGAVIHPEGDEDPLQSLTQEKS